VDALELDRLPPALSNKSATIFLTKGEGSGIASKGKDDPRKRTVMITVMCEKEV
jgi:hypothetical protein